MKYVFFWGNRWIETRWYKGGTNVQIKFFSYLKSGEPEHETIRFIEYSEILLVLEDKKKRQNKAANIRIQFHAFAFSYEFLVFSTPWQSKVYKVKIGIREDSKNKR